MKQKQVIYLIKEFKTMALRVLTERGKRTEEDVRTSTKN